MKPYTSEVLDEAVKMALDMHAPVGTNVSPLARLIAERDRYRVALERIAGHDPTKENAQSLFDAENIAEKALEK